MKLVEILNKANAGYPDGKLGDYYDPETGDFNPAGEGDGLARFIVTELIETYAPNHADYLQIEMARRAISRAMLDLSLVHRTLQKGGDT